MYKYGYIDQTSLVSISRKFNMFKNPIYYRNLLSILHNIVRFDRAIYRRTGVLKFSNMLAIICFHQERMFLIIWYDFWTPCLPMTPKEDLARCLIRLFLWTLNNNSWVFWAPDAAILLVDIVTKVEIGLISQYVWILAHFHTIEDRIPKRKFELIFTKIIRPKY